MILHSLGMVSHILPHSQLGMHTEETVGRRFMKIQLIQSRKIIYMTAKYAQYTD